MDTQESSGNIEAWQKMKDLLDAEMPVTTGNNKNNNSRYSAFLLILLIGGCGVYRLLEHNKTSTSISKNDIVSNEAGQQNVRTNNTKNREANEGVKKLDTAFKKTEAVNSNDDYKKAEALPSEKNIATYKSTTHHVSYVGVNKTSTANTYVIPGERTSLPVEQKLDRRIAGSKSVSTNNVAIDNKKELRGANLMASMYRNENNEGSNKNALAKSKVGSEDLIKDDDSSTLPRKEYNTERTNPAIEKENIETKSNLAIEKRSKVVKVESKKILHYGLEWGTPLPFNNNTFFIEANAKKQPLTILIPSVWISKQVSKNSSVFLSVNPYSQYLLNNTSTVQSRNYSISSVSASGIDQPAHTVNIAQTYSLDKVIGVEAVLQYVYQLSNRWSLGVGLGNTFTNTALLSEEVTKNKTEVIKDSLYGVIKTDKDWKYIKNNFFSGKVNVAYNFKRYQIGASLMKPLTSVYISGETKQSPLNMQLFLRWMWK